LFSSMLLSVRGTAGVPAARAGYRMLLAGGVSWTVGATCFEAPHACPPCCLLTDVSRDRAGQPTPRRKEEAKATCVRSLLTKGFITFKKIRLSLVENYWRS